MATKKATHYGWLLVPCTPYVAPNGAYTAECPMLEGYSDEYHSHWLNGQNVEVITVHPPGERVPPNCSIRRPG